MTLFPYTQEYKNHETTTKQYEQYGGKDWKANKAWMISFRENNQKKKKKWCNYRVSKNVLYRVSEKY